MTGQPLTTLRDYGHSLLIALQFLTRIPVPDHGNHNPVLVGRSLLCYPAVGLLIGCLLWGLQYLLQLLLPQLWSLQAALILTGWCLITGGLHLDGLADSADAWLGGLGDRQRTLELMKDPTCGSAAVLVLVLVLLIKFSALQLLISSHPGWLILAPVMARSLLLVLFLSTDYVREGGLGEVLSQYFPKAKARILLLFLALLFPLIGELSLVGGVLLGNLLLFIGLRHLMVARIGGATGDTAGALVVLSEATSLVLLLIFL